MKHHKEINISDSTTAGCRLAMPQRVLKMVIFPSDYP